MGNYQQFGTGLWSYGASEVRRASVVGRVLLTVAFFGAVCLIVIVIGAASVQYP